MISEKNLRIASNKHDLTGIRVFDKSEESIINLGFVSFDIETGKNRFINTSSKKYVVLFRAISMKSSLNF